MPLIPNQIVFPGLPLTKIIALCCAAFSWMNVAAGFSEGEWDGLPANATGIDVVDQVGDFIPMDLQFRDDSGKVVRLEKYFQRGKPIVMTLNYSDCPGLCIAQLENLVETLRATDAKGLGEDYEIVTISIDPREDSQKASRTKAKYTGLLRGTGVNSSWHFLVGKQPEITRLAESLGYYYTYDKVNDRFNHPAVTFFLSSEGRICRYFVDLGIEPSQFKLAVTEAAEGKLTRSLAEVFVQFCYYYDPEANRYSADARRIMALAGAAFVLLVLGGVAPFWFSSKTNREAAAKRPSEES
jgi:protein SCO1